MMGRMIDTGFFSMNALPGPLLNDSDDMETLYHAATRLAYPDSPHPTQPRPNDAAVQWLVTIATTIHDGLAPEHQLDDDPHNPTLMNYADRLGLHGVNKINAFFSAICTKNVYCAALLTYAAAKHDHTDGLLSPETLNAALQRTAQGLPHGIPIGRIIMSIEDKLTPETRTILTSFLKTPAPTVPTPASCGIGLKANLFT